VARSEDDIIESLQESTAAIDTSICTSYGPVYESMHKPWAKEAAYVEGLVEHLGAMWQLENVDDLAQAEIEQVGLSYGIEFGRGDPSQGHLLFWTLERPVSDINIDEGTLASTEDGNYIYKTLVGTVMYSLNAEAYWNSSTRRYEITVAAEAVETGSDYDAKATRINTMINSIQGITGVYNVDDFEGGTADQTIAEYAKMLQALQLGNSLGTDGGLMINLYKTYGGSIWDLAVVTPADVGVYERIMDTNMRAAVDIYVLGSRLNVDYQSYTTLGTETSVVLTQQPAKVVTSVLINGVAASFVLTEDIDPAKRGSVNALSTVTWTYPSGMAAVAGNSVYITYTYNGLIATLQEVSEAVQGELFDTSTVVREGKAVPTTVRLTINSYGVGNRQSDVETWVTRWFRDTTQITTKQRFIGEADPDIMRKDLERGLGVTLKHIEIFRRDDMSTWPVQIIGYEANEYPDLDLTILSAG